MRTKEMMAKAFVIPPTHLPTLIPPFLPSSHPSSWPKPEVHLFFSAVARLVRGSCCFFASGKWRLLQTHKLPIWRGISGKGLYEPFLTHSANTEVSKVAKDRTSLFNKLQAWVKLCGFRVLYV